jgi:hypothetical protein
MSKMDGLRAMREARYADAQARAATPVAPKTPARRPSSATQAQDQTQAQEPETPAETGEALCGHRAISGRTCTREAGHAAKSHRYS